ncbi:hypothetical protein ACOIDL_28260, partial [Klebsiella pneumoniae]
AELLPDVIFPLVPRCQYALSLALYPFLGFFRCLSFFLAFFSLRSFFAGLSPLIPRLRLAAFLGFLLSLGFCSVVVLAPLFV